VRKAQGKGGKIGGDVLGTKAAATAVEPKRMGRHTAVDDKNKGRRA
jgi:hypothetical protein